MNLPAKNHGFSIPLTQSLRPVYQVCMCNTKGSKIRHTKFNCFFILQPKEPQGARDPGFYSSGGGGWEEEYRVCSHAPLRSAGNHHCLKQAEL